MAVREQVGETPAVKLPAAVRDRVLFIAAQQRAGIGEHGSVPLRAGRGRCKLRHHKKRGVFPDQRLFDPETGTVDDPLAGLSLFVPSPVGLIRCPGGGPGGILTAQGIVHSEVDVQWLDCDFYAFSGHKIYAATGTGVLYGKRKWLDRMPPYMGGGEMVGTVKFSGTTYAPLPLKFEAGTQNFAGISTLSPALALASGISKDPCLKENERKVRDYVLDALCSDKRIKLYGCPHNREKKIPLFSFSVEGAHHEDLALILDKMGIATRSGQMCAEPLMDRFGVTGMLRASFAPYNTMQEAEYFIKCLDRAIGMLL